MNIMYNKCLKHKLYKNKSKQDLIKRIKELEDSLSMIADIKDIKNRIDLERKYSYRILAESFQAAKRSGDWSQFNFNLSLKESSEDRISALRWVLKEINLEHIDIKEPDSISDQV